jgi:hypothetical protein
MMSAMAVGSLLAAGITPAAASTHVKPRASITFTTVSVKPAANLVDGQVVNVKVTDAKGKTFNGTTTLYFAECSPLAVTKLSEDYCDTTNIGMVQNPTGSTASSTVTIHTSTAGDFKAANKAAVCGGFGHLKCIILVVDSTSTSTVTSFGESTIGFKDLRPASITKLASKKAIAVHKFLTLTAKVTHKGTTAPTGTVTFKDGKKKLKTVKEPKSGKVSIKVKFAKAGVQHITATYSGDKNYKGSVGKETVKVKK